MDEMTTEVTEVAETGVQIGTSAVDLGLHMIEVADIEAGALEQGTWMKKQIYRYLEEVRETYQMFS